MEIVINVIVGALALLAVVLSVSDKKRRRAVHKLENYAISLEAHDGFHFVHLKLAGDDGALSTYELAPEYSHVLSDELLQASALALRESHAAAK